MTYRDLYENAAKGEKKMDLIDRQKAIDECYPVTVDGEVYEVVQVETLMGLPSEQPEASILTVTVSPDSGEIERIVRKIKDEPVMVLPSAQPKTGRWEKMEARGRVYRCNQCGNFLDFDGVNVGRGDANFCPNCGARMHEADEYQEG